jgi:hypothetical protein
MSDLDLPALAATPNRWETDPDTYVEETIAFLDSLEDWAAALPAFATAITAMVSGLDFNGTSTSSVTIGTGAKSFTTQAGKLWQTGQYVMVANTSAPSNYMLGQVTGYSGTTLNITVPAGGTGGSGTLSAWSIGIAPVPGTFLALGGGTLSGLLTTATPASGQEALVIPHGADPTSPTNGSIWTKTTGVFARIAGSTRQLISTVTGVLDAVLVAMASTTDSAGLRLPHGVAPTAPTNGDIWSTTTAFFARINGTTRQLATTDGTETLASKTLADPILTGTMRHDIYAIVDGAGFAIDPRNGDIQTITLGASRTPTVANFNAGDMVEMLIDDGTGYTIDWSTIGVTWIDGTPPTLRSSGYTRVRLYRIGSTYYGEEVAPKQATFGITYVGGKTSSGTLGGSATTPTISLTDLTGGLASAPVQNDFVVVALCASASGGGSDLNLTMSSAGWTEQHDLFADSTSDTNLAVYTKKMGSSPDTSFQLSIPASSGHSYAVAVQVFRGVDTTNPLDVANTTASGTTTILVDPPAATQPVSALNCLVLIGGGAHNAGTRTFSASYLNSFLSVGQDNASGDATVGMGYLKNILTAYNGAAWTFSTTDAATYSNCSVAMVLRAA